MIKKSPLVTVLMTNYNCEKYLPESIGSVLKQTYSKIQFIIVDDGSTDGSVDVIRKFVDDRIELYISDKNEHISSATNRGMKYAKGDYLAIMDSDDVWEKDKLEKQLDYLEKHTELQGCFSWVSIIDENGKNVTREYKEVADLFAASTDSREEWLRFFFYIGNRLSNPSSLVQMEAAREIGEHRYHLVQGHDFDWWIRFTMKYQFGIIEENLMKYRRFSDLTKGNVSGNSKQANMRFFNECIWIRSHFFDEMEDELFIRTFAEKFVNADSSTKEELECEKAFLLCSSAYRANSSRIVGLNKLAKLLEDEKMRQILKEKFHFDQKDFYKMNAEHLLWTDQDEQQYQELQSLSDSQKEMLDLQQLHIAGLQTEVEKIPHLKDHINVLEALICKLNENINKLESENKNLADKSKQIEEDLKSENRNLADKVKQVEEEMAKMQETFSWRITKPLRILKQWIYKR